VDDNTLINLPFLIRELGDFLIEPNAYRSILILFGSILLAYWLSKLVANLIVKLAQLVSSRGDQASDEIKFLRYRQLETYLSVTVAIVRVAVVSIVAFMTWNFLSPISSTSVAAIGAGTVFIVVAGQTLGMVLRDITAGTTMIAEKWFNVGDFIKVEPFLDVSGVVERMTLRSTKIRSLSGEVIWMHNQQMQAVHVTPYGLRTLAVDVFAREKEEGQIAIKSVMKSIPKGPTMLAHPLKIKSTEAWGENLWRITVIGQTPPGREWLIDRYFIEALETIDDGKAAEERLFPLKPIVRYADPKADSRFRRAIRIKRDEQQ